MLALQMAYPIAVETLEYLVIGAFLVGEVQGGQQ